MIEKPLFEKNEIKYGLLTSPAFPHVFIPVKILIKDLKFKSNNQQYKVKILDFYDNIHILKKYWFNFNIQYQFDDIGRKNKIVKHSAEIEKPEDVLKIIHSDTEESYYCILESLKIFSSLTEMRTAYDKLTDFFVWRNLKELKEMQCRTFYQGKFKAGSYESFNKKIKPFLYEMIASTDNQYEMLMKDLTRTH